MGGYFPGPLGFAAFVGVKFGGYALAGIALKKLQPAVTGSALKIAAARTGLGVVLGPPITLLGGMILGLLFAGVRVIYPLTLATSFYGLCGFLYGRSCSICSRDAQICRRRDFGVTPPLGQCGRACWIGRVSSWPWLHRVKFLFAEAVDLPRGEMFS